MSARLVTAADVHAAAADGRTRLVVEPGTIVTALARDVARDRGVVLHEGPTGPPPQAEPRGSSAGAGGALEDRVRRIVVSLLGSGGAARPAAPPARGVKLVRREDVVLEPFPFAGPAPGHDVAAVDVVTADDGAPMAAGFLTLTKGEFPWTLTYDEVQYVIEGELHIGTAHGTRVGRAGDLLYVPKGSAITFGTPTWAKFLYVTFPADWADGRT